jgi:hypothetical protein
VALGADAWRVRTGSTPQVLAALRKVVVHRLDRVNCQARQQPPGGLPPILVNMGLGLGSDLQHTQDVGKGRLAEGVILVFPKSSPTGRFPENPIIPASSKSSLYYRTLAAVDLDADWDVLVSFRPQRH